MTSENRHQSSVAGAASTSSAAKNKPVDVHFALFNAISNARYRQTKLLIDAGADVNCVDELGRTPLIVCCCQVRADQRRQMRLLKLLAESGVDFNQRDNRGKTAIMHAAALGLAHVIGFMMEQSSVNLELQDGDGNTVLMHAASSGHTDVVTVLLKQMGRLRQVLHLNQRNHHGHTALEMAERNGHYEIVAKLGGTDKPPPLCHPGQLERGPTPATPLPFPARLRMQVRRRRSSREDVLQDNNKDWPALSPSEEVDSRPNRGFPSLSRFRLAGEPAIDLSSSYSSTVSEPSQDVNRGGVVVGEEGVDSNYHQVLNRLDLSIGRAATNGASESAAEAAVTGQRTGRVPQLCHGRNNYFPPIRPLNKECRSILAKHKDR